MTVDAMLRDFAANLIRVVRDAGKPYEIGHQAAGLVKTYESFRIVPGHYSSSDRVSEAFAEEEGDRTLGCCDAEESLREHYEQMIINGALQVIASRLIGQKSRLVILRFMMEFFILRKRARSLGENLWSPPKQY